MFQQGMSGQLPQGPIGGQQRLQIHKLFIQETGTYNQMVRRPYTTVVTGDVLNQFREQLAGSPEITPGVIGGVAASFVQPQAVPEKMIQIPGESWDRPRLQFWMEVSYRDYMGTEVREFLQGMTDYVGVIAHTGSLDPRMVFYVNSITKARVVDLPTAFGRQHSMSPYQSSHVLFGAGFDSVINQHDTAMRPQDIFTTMTRSHIAPKRGTLVDSRTSLLMMPTMSRRTNTVASNWLADVLRGYKEASQGENFGQTNTEILSNARSAVAEELTTKDPFLLAVANTPNHGELSNSFTYADLVALDPTLEGSDRVVFVRLGVTERAKLHEAGITNPWTTADFLTVKATELSQQVPGILMECGLQAIEFTSSNDFPGLQPQTSVVGVDGIAKGQDLTPNVQRFLHSFTTKILRAWTLDNQFSYTFTMRVDLLLETWLELVIQGERGMFVTPSFCDALLTPVLTQNQNHALHVAEDFHALTNVVENQSAVPKFPGNHANW